MRPNFAGLHSKKGCGLSCGRGPIPARNGKWGGFPWWLLQQEDIRLRTRDPRYLGAAQRYVKEVGRVLGPLQITQGGPILMVQVENEYGFFGKDAAYMGEIRQALVDAGFSVPLFACNPAEHLKDGYRSDLFPVVNFGSNPEGSFKKLREVLPQGPLMCGEFYPGWFDTWGQPHHTGKTQQYLKDLEYMLSAGASFSIYMVHGGTTFGLWSGADRPFKPDTSSYDYDAPISEAGWPTDKFFQTRALFARYLMPGESVPEPPATNAVITFAPTEVQECAPLLENLPKGITDTRPGTMEQYGQGYGCILYRTQIPAGPAASVEAAAVHDLGLVFLDGHRVGFMDRRGANYKVGLPARAQMATLDILVEAMGRVNFGAEVHDQKGLHGPVKVVARDGQVIVPTSWQVYPLPLDSPMLGKLRFKKKKTNAPAFWRAQIEISAAGDTFLDLSSWGKGVAWVNGHCVGRFWNIGPTQTMYVPGPWLKPGRNQVVILDLLGPTEPVVAGVATPVLDQLRPDQDFSLAPR